jgi:homodimeric pyruvate:ferredoxin (flavodoxin) oxidoreductase
VPTPAFLSAKKHFSTNHNHLPQASRVEPVIPSWQRQNKFRKYPQTRIPYDGATAAAYVAYAWSDQAFIYPITPATAMGDCVANWAGAGRKNLFGEICEVTQMQSEGGAAGACHGVAEVGSCVTTFTSSQGLLLMIPNMYILAGALNPCVIHVAARAVTKHALCIFGDQTDVMACRQTGFAMLCGNNVQQAQDMALVSHISTLKTSVPFMNFFDGFRTSHEISKPAIIPYEAMQQLVPWGDLQAFRDRGLNPNKPHSRQLGQFADTFFQNAEAGNKYYDQTPQVVQEVMNDVAFITGRNYELFVYKGHPQAEHLIVSMGSGCCVVDEYLQSEFARDKKYGTIHVKLFRPWDARSFLDKIPRSVKTITVLDRTKENGSVGEPLYQDVATSLIGLNTPIKVYGGRYGLGSREFTPGMVAAVFDNAQAAAPKNSFSVGIDDDVTFRSLVTGPEPDTCPPGTRQCIFWGMGSDGTVSANKSAIKLIGENTDMFVQGYFAYDSKKAGGCTISHLRFGPTRFESPYQVIKADYIGVSETTWPRKFGASLLEHIRPGGTAVFNARGKTAEEAEKVLPQAILKQVAEKGVNLYMIDAEKVARGNGLGRHTNNILANVFFNLADIIPWEKAENLLENNVRKAFKLKGDDVVNRNLKAMSEALENLNHIKYDRAKWQGIELVEKQDLTRPAFVREVMDKMTALQADKLPVSSFDPRGHMPNDTAQYEKRGIAYTVPIVDMETCTQCNKCAAICPHAAIRPFLVTQDEADKGLPLSNNELTTKKAKGGAELSGLLFRIQVAPEDCTGCEACSWACGDMSLTMTPLKDELEKQKPMWDYLIDLPNRGHLVDKSSFKGSQFQLPQLEFSGACEGCGETPYAKMVTQLFGPRMVIANASGCSSVWAGTGGFSPLTVNEKGQGPAWGRSLFEDAAEYGFGMARALKQKRDNLAGKIEDALHMPELNLPPVLRESFQEWLEKKEDADIAQDLAERIPKLMDVFSYDAEILHQIYDGKDNLTKFSTWIWGGDGWAYDIGFGGLDHVLAGGTDVNILVMDTEGYSNTGGQVSKATNLGAVQKFAPEGYRRAKKDLGAIAMAYEDVYVASISMGANYGQSCKAMMEADAYPGTSLILSYAPCIEHKILFPRGLSRLAEEMKFAATSGYWPMYRYNPEKTLIGENPFTLDQKSIPRPMDKFTGLENRFKTLHRSLPDVAEQLSLELQDWATRRHETMKWRESRDTESSDGIPLNLLVGTDTGVTMELAQRTAGMARARGFNVTLQELNEIADIDDLTNMQNIMVMCSTAGEGDMPGSAESFWEFFNEPTIDVDEKPLKDCRLFVFGLGDTSYRLFNKAALDIEKRFNELGAVSMVECGMGNDQDDDKFETAFEEWLPKFWEDFGTTEEPDADLIPEPLFELYAEHEPWTKQTVMAPSTKMLNLQFSKRITPEDYDRIIYHISFDRKGRDYPFLLGDAMAIYPPNNSDQIKAFLNDYLGKDFDHSTVYRVQPTGEVDKRRQDSYRRPMTIEHVFTEIVDVLGRPNKHFYKGLARFATDAKEKEQLSLLVTDSEEGKAAYKAMSDETVTYVDVLKQFPSAHPPLEHLISMIPCIKPRLYSIASSPRFLPDTVELMIVILDWWTPSGKEQRGLSTNFIQRLCTDDEHNAPWKGKNIPVGLTNGTFNFPEDTTVPLIMTGLGTGLAPFRAFIQEWKWHRAQGRETGNTWLFYGCRHEKKDFCFQDELYDFQKEGVLTELRPAFSRDQKEKIYVQHKMSEVPNELYEDLVQKGGYFYLCGQAGALEIDVENAIKKAVSATGEYTTDDASQYVEDMHHEGRYNLELY